MTSGPRVDLPTLLPSARGHFKLESGHHGDLWLDVERLCLQVPPVDQFAGHLADELRNDGIEVVCGPLVDGAFVALLVAAKLGVKFTYAERVAAPSAEPLYPFHYRIPDPLRSEVHGRRVAIINDVINAGSAVRGTFIDLKSAGATVVSIGAVAALGDWAERFATGERLHLAALETFANTVWAPDACPLCAQGEPLHDPLGAMGRR